MTTTEMKNKQIEQIRKRARRLIKKHGSLEQEAARLNVDYRLLTGKPDNLISLKLNVGKEM